MHTANIQDAVYLIDDDSFKNGAKLRSSWDYFDDGQTVGVNPSGNNHWLLDTDNDREIYLRRDCNAFKNGKMTFETLFETVSGNGLYMAFGSRTKAFLTLVSKKEQLYIGKTAVSKLPYGKHYLKLVIDLENNLVDVGLDSKNKGRFALNKKAFAFTCLRIGFGANDKGVAKMYFTKLYVNYLYNDRCLNPYIGKLPDGFKVSAPKGSTVKSDIRVAGKNEYTYVFNSEKGAVSTVRHSFDKATGKVTLDMMYLLEQSDGCVHIALKKGTNTVVSVWDKGEELHLYNDAPLRKHHKTVWQTVRMQADTDTKKAIIWLDGKKTVECDFEEDVKYIDGFEIRYEAENTSKLMFSDIYAWVKPEEPADYVPKPIVPKKKGDYVVGMNICSLWREGTHYGWDAITPFDDITPVLGYYDEGLPETSDWEIKFFVEHGIDYELYCWYSSESSAPIKTTHLHYAWTEGHFYAKYADMEKFALLWEAANCQHPTCLEDFKYNLVPYWLDYFFSDDRYMRIDNKAIMSCFGVWCVERDLGGPEKVREGLQYLRDEVKKLGYDDLIVMGCHAEPAQLKNLGYDAFHAYHWGSEGYKLKTNIDSNNSKIAAGHVHVVPTVSVGFKNIGWGGDRRPNLAAEDMYNGLKYCMDKILPTYEKGSWKSKLLHLSTWNEYGEGTYMMPSGLNGFGYLDAVRKAVCVDEPYENTVPTEKQKERIGYLYAKGRRMLSRSKYDVRDVPKEEKAVATYTFKNRQDLDKWDFHNMENVKIEKGKLVGKSLERLSYMQLKAADFDASKIAYAKIVCTNKAGNGMPTGGYLLPSDKVDINDGDVRYGAGNFWCRSQDCASYTVDLDTLFTWRDTVTGFKVIPTLGGTFEIESITLYAASPHYVLLNQAGKTLYFGKDYLQTKNGEVYVPLDPESGLFGALGIRRHYDWDKAQGRLDMTAGNLTVSLTVGKAYATKNGASVTLVRPPYLKDGIPAIALSDIKKLFDIDCDITDNKIKLR